MSTVKELVRRSANTVRDMATEVRSKVEISALDTSTTPPSLPLSHNSVGARQALHILDTVEPHLTQRQQELRTLRADIIDALQREGSPITPLAP